jgi:tetratricopeptide (TPR) repeat protein
VLAGDFSSAPAYRGLLEKLRSMTTIEHGLVRILSPEVRGYIAVFRGTVIIGAQCISPTVQGMAALNKLLSAGQGMLTFIAVDAVAATSLGPAVSVDLGKLLDWRAPEGGVPPIADALRCLRLEQLHMPGAENRIQLPATIDSVADKKSAYSYVAHPELEALEFRSKVRSVQRVQKPGEVTQAAGGAGAQEAVEPEFKVRVLTPEQQKILERVSIAGFVVVVGLAGLLIFELTHVATAQQKFCAGLAAMKQKDYARAKMEFNDAAQMDPGSPSQFYRGISQSRLGQPKDAAADYDDLIGRYPKDAIAYAARAALFMKMKKYGDAIADCNRIIELQPGYMDAYRIRAAAFCEQDLYTEAVDDATKYLNAGYDKAPEPARVQALATRAAAYFNLDNFKKSLEDYDLALTLDPKNEQLKKHRELVAAKLKANG